MTRRDQRSLTRSPESTVRSASYQIFRRWQLEEVPFGELDLGIDEAAEQGPSQIKVDEVIEGSGVGLGACAQDAQWWRSPPIETSSKAQSRLVRKKEAARVMAGSW
jgi:hypothetical protein